MKKLWPLISSILITTTPITIVTSCAQDPIETYFAKMLTLLNSPETLIKVQIKPQYWVDNNPQKINLSQSDLFQQSQQIFDVVPLQPWIDWNEMINNDPNLNDQAKSFLTLDQKSLLIPIVSDQPITNTLSKISFYLNLSNGKFTNVVKSISLDLSQTTFIKPIINNQAIDNTTLKRALSAIANSTIKNRDLTVDKINQDQNLIHIHLNQSDFNKIDDPILKQLVLPNLHFYYDWSQPLVANRPINLLAYFSDQPLDLSTNSQIINQIKTKQYYLETELITIS